MKSGTNEINLPHYDLKSSFYGRINFKRNSRAKGLPPVQIGIMSPKGSEKVMQKQPLTRMPWTLVYIPLITTTRYDQK